MLGAVAYAVADSKVRPGWIAFFIVIGLCVATFVLWRSMNKQLGRISVDRGGTGRPAGPVPGDPHPVGGEPIAGDPGVEEPLAEEPVTDQPVAGEDERRSS